MSERRSRGQALWAALATRVDEVRSLVDRADDDSWMRVCEGEGWTVGLVACHITLGLRRQVRWVQRAVDGRPPHAFDWERTHSLNALVARRALQVERASVLESLSDGAERWRAVLTSASDYDLDRPAFRYKDCQRNVEWIAGVLTPRHIDEHMRRIRLTIDDSTGA